MFPWLQQPLLSHLIAVPQIIQGDAHLDRCGLAGFKIDPAKRLETSGRPFNTLSLNSLKKPLPDIMATFSPRVAVAKTVSMACACSAALMPLRGAS